MSLRILYVDRASARSIWSLLTPVARAAMARGDRASCALWQDGGADRASPLIEAVEGLALHPIPVGPAGGARRLARQHMRFASAFRALLARETPDIVHVNFAVPGALAALLADRARPRPRVLVARHELRGSMAAHLRLAAGLAARRADAAVHVSRAVAVSYGEPDGWIIPNGIDVEAAAAAREDSRPAQPGNLVLAGRLVPEKGQRLALDAFARAAPDLPGVTLDLIGEGPDRGELERRAAGLPVRFLGWRAHGETLRRMRAARAVLVPSDGRQEGFGLVLAEAMAAGAPVMASAIPVFEEVARFGRGVRLLPPGDPGAWAAAMRAPPVPARLDADLSQEAMAAGYLALYDALRARPAR